MKNIYLLLSGASLIITAAVHAVFGEINVFKTISKSGLDDLTKISVHIPWHQLTFILLLSGVILIVISFKNISRLLPLFILLIIIGNLLVFLVIAIIQKNWFILQNSVPQYILFVITVVLLILGIKKTVN